jgi:hypothetical protein
LFGYRVQLFGIVREQRFGMPSQAAEFTKEGQAEAQAKTEAKAKKEEGPTSLRLVCSSAKFPARTSGLLAPLASKRAARSVHHH